MGIRYVYSKDYSVMEFRIGDCAIAKLGAADQVGIIHKVSDVSCPGYPDRTIFSVRFQSDMAESYTFVYGEQMWVMPTKGAFEPLLKEVMRKGEIVWSCS